MSYVKIRFTYLPNLIKALEILNTCRAKAPYSIQKIKTSSLGLRFTLKYWTETSEQAYELLKEIHAVSKGLSCFSVKHYRRYN